MIPVSHFLAVGAVLFVLGLIGFLTRRNLIVMFLCSELMLQGVAVNLVAFSRYHANLHGQTLTMFVVTVAACEAAVALALILMLYRRRKSLDVSVWVDLREPGQDVPADEDMLPTPPVTERDPRLPVAGREPAREEGSYV